ncbi:calphotin-like [Procambarus clarkii]|uniref:calphotin-like n=1 Tax=Procambarus clarkii TaxID=6728 RepID=UPI003742BF81
MYVFREKDFPPQLTSDASEDGVGAVPEAPDCLSAALPVEAVTIPYTSSLLPAVVPEVVVALECMNVGPSPALRVVDVPVDVYVPPPSVDVATGCDAAPVAQVNLFREEDFPPLPLDEDSGGEEMSVPFVAEAPPASPDVPPVVIDPPPDVAVPSDATPAPVAVAPVDLPVAPCEASPCAYPTSAAAPGPASSPRFPAVLGAGVAVGAPDVCGPVPPVVEAAAVLRRASVRPASGARVSESASGSDDLRPVPKRSRHSSSAWADVGEFSDCGSSGVDGVVPDASLAPQLVVAVSGVS